MNLHEWQESFSIRSNNRYFPIWHTLYMQTISVLLSRNCFRHAFVTNGECVMKYSGEEVRMVKGDCVIIISNLLVTEIQPTENFHAKVIFIEPGFMEACTPHTSYGIVGG